MRGRWELSDAQWRLIEPILRPRRRSGGRGRPWQDTRAVLNGILWVLGTRGAVARTAQEISAVPDLPSPFSAVGAGAQTGAHLARSWLRSESCGRVSMDSPAPDNRSPDRALLSSTLTNLPQKVTPWLQRKKRIPLRKQSGTFCPPTNSRCPEANRDNQSPGL
jgi:hypothetical protein